MPFYGQLKKKKIENFILSAMSVRPPVSAIQNFLSFRSYPSVDQPKVNNGEVKKGGSVDM